ncbi:hypothetical protein NLG97_g4589 [Lecanicillium saksenae]|uniref:Uncharacterized protein n=1 Tax=Lecanicillium saksenae TaxID=468837 RepID=A0ACC1QWP0_9HYPO|nr:hypothetical protein NLG97_g4589 [Lecanicillium saksenae]
MAHYTSHNVPVGVAIGEPSQYGQTTRGAGQARSVRSNRSSNSNGEHGYGTGISTPSAFQYSDEFRYRTMATYIYNRVMVSGWIHPDAALDPNNVHGVLIRRSRGQYLTVPDPAHPVLYEAVKRMNLAVAVTIRPRLLEGIMMALTEGQTELRLKDGSQLQVIDSLNHAHPTTVKKYQYACICQHERMLLVWHDDISQVLSHAAYLEEKLLTMIWGSGKVANTVLNSPFKTPSIHSSSGYNTPAKGFNEKTTYIEYNEDDDEEIAAVKEKAMERPESLKRPVMRTSAFFIGLAMAVTIVLLVGVYIGRLVSECLLDGSWVRMALVFPIPLLACVSLFFFQIVFSDIFQIIGPIGGNTTNSRFYSCHKPSLERAYMEGMELPKVTIQMPVYKEGMESVIIPTIRSLQQAVSFYESHGGSATIFINDDGIRAGLSPSQVRQRQEYYHNNNIGWVARPRHNGDEGYVRKGKFKKASNMNFALNFSQRVEKRMQEMMDTRVRTAGSDYLDDAEEEELYNSALGKLLDEEPLAWADGDIRVGEIILLVDSDTRVPIDCLLYGAAEMFLSPEVAIVQHSTGVMQVTRDYFENGITYFTNLVYSSIRFSIGAGEVAPFVGHNAFLRWRAVQDVGRPEQDGAYTAYWSESHVSEDFDIALRLQMQGSVIRIASYHNDEFKEGVSLTIYDEIMRWQKYAYGVSEMIFHPLHRWIFRGPFTPLFYTFIFSNIMWSSKISIISYMCSYFALGSALFLTCLNYFLIGWMRDELASSYLTSWNVFLSLIVVFNGAGPIALAILRYRTGERSLIGALFENYKWMPLMTVFFGGISYHITVALLAHLFYVDMQWGSTSKEKVDSNFFQEVPRIFKTFWTMYVFIFLMVGAMIYLGIFAPPDWAIRDFSAIVPLAINLTFHALVPFVLNPSLMIFAY